MRTLFSCVALMGSAAAAAAAEPPPARVLILGDGTYNPISRDVGTGMKGVAAVKWVHPGDTGSALANLDKLLGDQPWDVIYFHFGLADLMHRDPATKSVRLMSRFAGGVRVTSPEQYETNLRELVARLKKTNARLVWGNTAPLADKGNPVFEPESVTAYNAIAARVMADNRVPVCDVYAVVTAAADGKTGRGPAPKPAIHAPIVKIVREELGRAE